MNKIISISSTAEHLSENSGVNIRSRSMCKSQTLPHLMMWRHRQHSPPLAPNFYSENPRYFVLTYRHRPSCHWCSLPWVMVSLTTPPSSPGRKLMIGHHRGVTSWRLKQILRGERSAEETMGGDGFRITVRKIRVPGRLWCRKGRKYICHLSV